VQSRLLESLRREGRSQTAAGHSSHSVHTCTRTIHSSTLDRVPPEAYATTPLFRRSSGVSFTTDYVREVVRFLMRSVGLPPGLYGGHSLRIGGASAALAANVSEAVIREPWVDGTWTFMSSTCGVRFRAPARWARLSPQLPTRISRRCSTTKSSFASHDLNSDHRALRFLGAALSSVGVSIAHTDSSLVSWRQACGLPRAAMACVPIRVQGRRAVAVLREASRPNRLIYSHWSRDAGGESRESTFVQREEGCGENLGYARLASRHHCKAAFGFAFVVWRTRARRAMASARPPDPQYVS